MINIDKYVEHKKESGAFFGIHGSNFLGSADVIARDGLFCRKATVHDENIGAIDKFSEYLQGSLECGVLIEIPTELMKIVEEEGIEVENLSYFRPIQKQRIVYISIPFRIMSSRDISPEDATAIGKAVDDKRGKFKIIEEYSDNEKCVCLLAYFISPEFIAGTIKKGSVELIPNPKFYENLSEEERQKFKSEFVKKIEEYKNSQK